MFSRHAPAARSLRTYRVSDAQPLRPASIRRSRSSPLHANRHGCELSAEGAAMPAHRMPAFVCRSTVHVRLWIGADSSRLRLTCVPGNQLAHAALYAGIKARTETRPFKNRKSGCEACWRLSAARHRHDARCIAYPCGVRLETGHDHGVSERFMRMATPLTQSLRAAL
jgi:hypothetical protein